MGRRTRPFERAAQAFEDSGKQCAVEHYYAGFLIKKNSPYWLLAWRLLSPTIRGGILPIDSLIGVLISLGTLSLLAALLFAYLKLTAVQHGLAWFLAGDFAAWRQKGLGPLYGEQAFF